MIFEFSKDPKCVACFRQRNFFLWDLLRDLSRKDIEFYLAWNKLIHLNSDWLQDLDLKYQREHWQRFSSCFRFYENDQKKMKSVKETLRKRAQNSGDQTEGLLILYKWDHDWLLDNLFSVIQDSKKKLKCIVSFLCFVNKKVDKFVWVRKILEDWDVPALKKALQTNLLAQSDKDKRKKLREEWKEVLQKVI
ncbi:MAG: hypothetical protein H7A33_07410 [Deltaproteobacteria bacterium]|nr:hypothetical protein [Deltaproteobacteria bacterium]